MKIAAPTMVLSGTLRLSDRETPRTQRKFNILVRDNAEVFKRYFGVELFPGSLNVYVPTHSQLQADLDAGKPAPSIIIPKTQLLNMPAYLGNGQAWPCHLIGAKFPEPIACWVFRRVGSTVDLAVIEIVAKEELRERYGLHHGDKVTIKVFSKGL